MVRLKEGCPPYRINCPLGRKPGGSPWAEEKPIRDTACRLHGKGLDMPCDSYWGWLLWFSRTLSYLVSFKNRNPWQQFENCLKSSSDHSAICIKLDLVKTTSFMHEWNARGTSIPLWLRNIKKQTHNSINGRK